MTIFYFYFAFSGLFNALVSVFLGLFILWRNHKSKINQTFALFCLGVALWSFPYILWPFANTAGDALRDFRLSYIGACFIPVFYFHFVVRWLDIYEKKKTMVYLSHFWAIALSLAIPTKLFIAGMVPKFSMKFWAEPGIFFHLYLVMFFGYFFYSSYLLFRKFRQETGLKKQQIKFVLIGMILSFLGASTNYFLWYGINIPPYGDIFASSFVIFTAYAILRYRLMDMRVIVRTFLIYLADGMYAYVFYSFLIIVYPLLWGSVYSIYAVLAGLVVTPIFVVTLFGFDKQAKRILDKYFFYSLYDFRKTITKLSAELNNYPDLDKIINLIVDTIKDTMGLDRAGVLLIDKSGGIVRYKIAKVIGFDITNGISLVKDNFLTRYLKQTAKPLVREELALLARDTGNEKDSRNLLNLEHEMMHIEASLCLPLLSGKELLGIIVLGFKNTGDPYTKEDLNLLSTLSNQAGIAINNARLYAESKNFNKLLQKQVAEQTSELKARAEHLEKLLKMREEFLDIASHQLKTPVSVIRGTISMFKDGSMDKLPKEEQRKFLDNIYHKTEKLNVIIADILRASEIDSEDFKIDPKNSQKVKVENILQSVYDDLMELAAEKQVTLELNLPKKPVPMILTSADFLEQAFYNLVDNAIKYTDKGRVKIDLANVGDEVIVKVFDNGIGIPDADKNKIFEKFSRAANAVNMYADGSGLGLFIVKRIIEAHPGGSIGFESQLGKGTVFTVKLKTAKAGS
ncbi:MAG: ATP-binding protein [Candidatus Buchananbacteria bacterium]|jgi:signal transduction histidine kinase